MSRTRSSVISGRDRVVEESKSVSSPRNSDRLKAEAQGGRAKTSTSKVSSVRPKIRGRYLHLLDVEDVTILEDVTCLVILQVLLHVAGVAALANELNCWLCKIPTVHSFGTRDVLVRSFVRCWELAACAVLVSRKP